MSDLKTEADSLNRAGIKLSYAADPLNHPLADFKSASHDLSAFGVLGSLLKATGEVREGMTELADVVTALHDEWQAEGKAMLDVGKVLDQVDRLLQESLARKHG
ncbi:hypothetical protein POF50_008735 [Streptomyces sp. SL13]|uniref:Uncharacterized protein n=1 Tax=Streptantibioticus silvisoli TaxID=2705255 RepID=A0AA90GZM5_9ACTN|nr:hypothetical protein [Streptantibioticus silvisoli]MDI5969426.1 hypothetical protein [Streptantibioticus silvisoli]